MLMVANLCMCGFSELGPSPASMGSLFTMMGFSIPQPQGRGAYNYCGKLSCVSVCRCVDTAGLTACEPTNAVASSISLSDLLVKGYHVKFILTP